LAGHDPHVPHATAIPPAGPETRRPASPAHRFLAFTTLALQGFGGVLPVAQRVLCDERRWLSREEFVELLAVGQALPGPNLCNVSIMVGNRFFGWRGAVAAGWAGSDSLFLGA
jgi:chromate transporter